MKTLVKRLPLFAFVLAAFAAFAFNAPAISMERTATKVWTPDSHPDYMVTNGYREITNEAIDVDYECDDSSQDCEVKFVNDNPFGTIESRKEGTYLAL